MNRARDRREGTPAYEQWLIDRQAEIDAEKAAQAAAEAADPVKAFQNVANAEAEASRQLVLTGRLSDQYMSDFGAVVRQPFTEAQVDTAMAQFMAETADYIKTRANGKVLTEFIWRNNISPGARTSYRLAYKILQLWNCFPDAENPVAQITQPAPEALAEPVLMPSEQFKVNQTNKDTVLGVVNGREITERVLEAMDSKTALYTRRVLEKGFSGNQNYDTFLEVKDAQFARDAEIARKAAEEAQQ
jgi:hypothetical protein